MSTSAMKNRRLGRWLVLAMAICIAVPAFMTIQGCCKSCCKPICPPTEHLVAIFLADGHTCAAPGMIVAKKGEWVLFINATQNLVTIKTPVHYQVFDGVDRVDGFQAFKLKPLEIKKLKVSSDADLHQPFRFTIDPMPDCPGYPGPGMDIDN